MPLLLRPLLAAVLLPTATAQPIATDRPDFTESPEVVTVGRLQTEAGATIHSDAPAGVFSGPELLLRFGLLDRLELRFEAPNYVDTYSGPRGFGDPSAGGKLRLGTFAQWGLAAIGMISVPVGDSAVSSGRLDPSFLVTASRDLPFGVALGAQAGAAFASATDRVDLSGTLVLGTGVTDRVATFVELAAADLAWDPNVVLHHGYTLSLGPDAQVDVHGGAGLSAAASPWFVGAGLAVRFGRGARPDRVMGAR